MNPKIGRKGVMPVVVILSILLAIVSIVAILSVYSNVTGEKPVRNLCQNTVGQWVDCSLLPFGQFPQYSSTGQVPAPTNPEYLSIKDLAVLMQDPESESWSAMAGTLRLFTKGTNVKDPTATAFATVTISSGAGSQSTWNKAQTDTEYVMVFDGAGTYYDKEWSPFYFLANKYNKALGSYTLTIDKVEAPPKVGTFGTFFVALSNSSGVNYTSTSLMVDDGTASGQFSFNVEIKNTGANTVLKDVVIHPKSDVSNPMEGNEFTAVTLQHSSGTDFALPADIKNYVANEVPIPVSPALKGGASGIYTVTFTYSSSNFAVATDKLYFTEDDLSGWLVSDVLPANKGATAQAYDITRGL